MNKSIGSSVDFSSASISVLSQLIRKHELSPVELINATIQRMEALQSKLDCFVTMTPELALEQAKRAEDEIMKGLYRGPLHGIPYSLKDVIATTGIRTTFGNPKGVDYKPKEDATVHSLLNAAGGVLIGKVVSEIGRDPTGPVGCRNPWNTDLSPGTSSSGSGSSIAASIGLASIGTDTGGSVRHPASNCGIVGMKATFGRISRFGVWASSWTTDQAEPLTRTVEDNAILLEILGVYDPKDPVSINEPSIPYRMSLNDGIKGLRIGVPIDDWVWKDWLSEEEEKVVKTSLQTLKSLGATLVDISLPLTGDARSILFSMAAEKVVFMEDNFSQEQINEWPEHHATLSKGREQSVADYLHAQHKRARICQEAVSAFKTVDIIAMPTGSTFGDTWNAEKVIIRGVERPARSRAVYRNALASLTGHPSISVPCGFGKDNTLPIGLMLQSLPLQEALLYRAAYAYEQASSWKDCYPHNLN